MSIDEGTRKLIEERVQQLRDGHAKNFFVQNILYPEYQKQRDSLAVKEEIKKLKIMHEKVKSSVKDFKKLIPEITEQSPICAAYLVYGKLCHTWEALFLLSENGFSFEIAELVRSINENLDLIFVFHLDNTGEHLAKWYKGEIIDNGVARRLIHDFVIQAENPTIKEYDASPYEMSTSVYRVLSKYTHCSYAALWDCIDVFSHDFDWNQYAGFHYTLNNIWMVKNTMTSTLTTLKMTYYSLGDMNMYKRTNDILVEFSGPNDDRALVELLERSKKKTS